jgi:hypothetical protein
MKTGGAHTKRTQSPTGSRHARGSGRVDAGRQPAVGEQRHDGEALENREISSTYIWHTNKSLPVLLVKNVESVLPMLKSLLMRKFIRHSYHALSACLSP